MENNKNNTLISRIIIFSIIFFIGVFFIWQWLDYYSKLKEYKLVDTKTKLIIESQILEKELFKLNEVIEREISSYKTKVFYDLLEENINFPYDSNEIKTFVKRVSLIPYCNKIYLFNNRNQLIYSYSENFATPSRKIIAQVKAITKPHDVIYSNIDNTIDSNKYLLSVFITFPSSKTKNTILAKMVLVIDAGAYYTEILNYKSKYFTSNEAYLIRKEKSNLNLVSQLKNANYNTLNMALESFSGGTIIDNINQGNYGITFGTNYNGKKVAANISLIDKKNWILVNLVRYNEIESELFKDYIKYILTNLIFLLLILLLSYLFFKKYSIDPLKMMEKNQNYELIVNRLRQGELIAKIGNWEIDLHTKKVFTSLGAREIYGVENDNLTLNDIKKYPLPEYRAMLDEELDKMLRFNIPYEVEFKIENKKDKSIRDIHSSAIFDRTTSKIYGVIKDITEQNKIKKKLIDAEERLRFAVEAGNYGIWDLDLNTGEHFWSDSSYKLIGYLPTEIKMSFDLWQQFVHPEDLRKILLTLDKITINAVSEFSHEFRIKHKNGKYLWMLGKGKVVNYSDSGKPIRIVGINLDINDKKQTELELKKIEWMLLRQSVIEGEDKYKRNLIFKTDSHGLIFENINKEVLQGIMFDYLQLLESSSIIFEQDGSYALGIFQSDWCINLHESKRLRKNEFTNGRCSICFYNEWEMCGKVAINKKEPIKHKCEAGIEIFSVPIFAFGQVIGSICTALTAPSEIPEELDRISNLYNLPSILVKKIASSYDIRPLYITELAKERISVSAKLIGTLVEKSITERDLFRNRELYRSLVESSDSIIVLVDSKSDILYVNQVAAQYFDQTSDKLIGQNLAEIFNDENLQQQLKLILQVFKGEKKVSEILNLSIKGENRLFRTNIFPVKNNEGEIYAALVNATDITDLKEAENQKRSLEEMFYSLLDYFIGGVFIKDRKGIVLYVNKYLKDLFNAESWIGKNAIDSFPGEIGERLFIDDMNTFEKGYQKIIETIPSKDGIERFYETHKFIINRVGAEPLLGGLTVDITSLIMAQKSLIEIKYQQEKILNALPDLIFELNNKFIIKWVNTFAEKYFGIEVIGKPITIFVKGIEDQIRFSGKDALDKVFYYESTVEINDEKKYFGWWFKAEFNENFELINIIAAARDITENKLYENEILKMNTELDLRVKERTAELESANKELEAFTYSVSHDLRSPLRAIDGFSRIILEDYSQVLDEEGVRLFNVIRFNAKKMDQLITDLLQLSRVTRQQIEKEEIDMTSFIIELYDEIANDEVKSKFQFICGKLDNIQADKTLLRQVWINLISNAIKYTLPKGNRVIEISSYETESEIVTKIKDSGVGFNQDYSNKLFGVFQRLHRTEEFDGTGVGLAVVKRIVDKHGGRVWAEGKVNEGAIFYVSFPKLNI